MLFLHLRVRCLTENSPGREHGAFHVVWRDAPLKPGSFHVLWLPSVVPFSHLTP
jgi:hypothetical protein